MAVTHGESVGASLTIRMHGQWTVVVPPAEVDPATAPHLHGALDQLHAAGVRHVAVDWCEVTFFDSSAISVLVGAHLAFGESGGRFAVVRTDGGGANRLFEIMGLDQVLTLVGSVSELD